MVMAAEKRIQVNILMEEELLQQVDDYRRAQSVIPNRTEAIKRLVRLGLAALQHPAGPAEAPQGQG